MFDNIAAISSGNVNQPISIIRVSGPESFDIVKKIFTGKIGSDKTITYGYIKDGEQDIDEVLVSWFKSPNTFTGEDIVEINAHGGVVNSNKILELLLANGARLAENGEFSKRAFLNKKIDLVKAEAIHDLIFSQTDSQAKLAVKKFDGQTSKLINNLKEEILTIIATIETNIDYPEYDDIEVLKNETLIPSLEKIDKKLEDIIESSKKSKFVYEGVEVVIVGKPNSGKSTLINALLNQEKAIVTNIPGTTRDIVEGSIQLGQLLLKIKDTAGIHSTSDEIEQIGIQKTLEAVKGADLIIHLIDPFQEKDKDDLLIESLCKQKPYIKVINKNDLLKEGSELSISAKNNAIEPLFNEISKMFSHINVNDEKIINNTRQLSLISAAKNLINEALSSLSSGFEPDLVIIDIHKAWENLANILGKSDETDLLDTMFKNFCLGK